MSAAGDVNGLDEALIYTIPRADSVELVKLPAIRAIPEMEDDVEQAGSSSERGGRRLHADFTGK